MQAKLNPVRMLFRPHPSRGTMCRFHRLGMFGSRIRKTDRALQRLACISVVWVVHLSAS